MGEKEEREKEEEEDEKDNNFTGLSERQART